MAQNDVWRRYLDVGMAFTELTRARAEAIIKDLVRAGEIPRQRAEVSIDELVERSKRNTDAVMALIKSQVREQLSALGIATTADIARLERMIKAQQQGPTAKKAPAAKKSTAKKAVAKKRAPATKKSAAKAAGE